jgi:hypothetical protein
LLAFATTTTFESTEMARRIGYLEGVLTPEQRKAYAARFKDRLNGNGNGTPGIGINPEAAAGEKQEEESDTHSA